MVKEKTKTRQNNKEELSSTKDLILHNDDFNSFDFVIETLIEVCNHDPLQAEQCSLIVHYKGKCPVKTGTLDELKPKCNELSSRGLTATID